MDDYIEPGLYRHFKGNRYQVIGEVFDADTNEIKVLYQSVWDCTYYSRSKISWVEPAQDVAGNMVERFKRISN